MSGKRGSTPNVASYQHTFGGESTRHHGIVIKSPLAKKSVRQIGVLYVDDTNIWAGLGEDDDEVTTAAAGQASIDEWGGGLIATGGDLNADKCAYTIHYQVPDGEGGWKYPDPIPTRTQKEALHDPMLEDIDTSEIEITVPQATSDVAVIKRLGTDVAVKNLGLYARPDGNNEPHFEQMKTRIEDWTVKVKNGELRTRSVWTSYLHQLWAGLRYGLAASSAPLKQLYEGLGKSDFRMLSTLGVAKTIKTEVRYIPPAFGGMGIRHLPIETTAATLNAFLQHYGEPSNLGHTLTTTLHHMQVEMGVQGCPLQYKYEVWEGLVTDSWIKALWEKISKYNIELDIKYECLLPPKERDRCFMEALVEAGWRGKDLIGVNRARKSQEVVWYSCMANATASRIEPHYLRDWRLSFEYELGRHRSTIDFGRELPTEEDWDMWERALRSLTVGNNLSFHTHLGKWKNESPRIWRAFLDEEVDEVILKGDDSTITYRNTGTVGRYRKEAEGPCRQTYGKPISVERVANDTVKLLTTMRSGDGMVQWSEQPHQDFRSHLESFGGSWMWDHLELGQDLQWLVDAIRDGTAVAVTDGSYNKKIAPRISGAGWIIKCRRSGREVRGSFYEYSTSAGSYRGELLGTLAINTFLLAVEEFYKIHINSTPVYCDNKGAVYTFSKQSKRIPSGLKHADIRRAKRSVEARLHKKLEHRHVYGHQDDRRQRGQLRLEARLNCICDDLAKGAVARAAMLDKLEHHPILPLEQAAVYLGGEKQTTDISHGLRYHIGRAQAKQFYSEKEGERLAPREFEDVAWEDLRRFHQGKPMMYTLWYGKQCSGYCGTGKWLRRWDSAADSSCPNCGVSDEDAEHLNRCPDFGRSQLWRRQVDELKEWLLEHDTQYHLARLIPAYLLGRGRLSFDDLQSTTHLTGGIPRAIRAAGHKQDRIGWRHFTEGKISMSIRNIQEYYLSLRPDTRFTIDSWMTGLIAKLVAMTHSQWIYRNITKHHHTHGTIKLRERHQITKAIEQQLELGTASLDQDCACLLEVPEEEIYNWSSEQQQYWLHAVMAARESGENALRVSNGTTTQWLRAVAQDGEGLYGSHTPYGEVEVAQPCLDQRGEPTAEVQSEHWGRSEKLAQGTTTQRQSISRADTRQSPDTQRTDTSTRRRGNRPGAHPNRTTGPTASEEARDADTLGMLEKPSVVAADKPRLDALLRRPMGPERRVIINGGDSISNVNFAVLGTANWLSDEIMNFAAKHILQPTTTDVHVYNSHFMTNLMGIPEDPPLDPTMYDYTRVRGYTRRINMPTVLPAERLDKLKALYVIINKKNVHWLYLKVIPREKRIVLRDSMGTRASNRTYMVYMLRYMYDVWKETHRDDNRGFTQWAQDWDCRDMSDSTPQQANGDDCGIFTLLTMYLEMQGVQIRADTYNQQWVDNNHTRRRLAYILLKSNMGGEPPPSLEQYFHRSPGKGMAATGRRRKRKSRSGEVIAIGGSRVRQRITYNIVENEDNNGPTNRKRTAKSIADEDATSEADRRVLTPPAKRTKGTDET